MRDIPYEVVISVEESANYLEASITRTITITKREVTIKLWDLTSSFNSALKTEGEYGFDIVSQTKLADGDDINDLAVSIKYIKEEETLNAGSYVITATSASTNYDVTIIDGVYTIGKLTDEIVIVQDTFVYDGTNHSVIAALSQSNTEQTLVYSLSNSQVNYAEEGYEVVISAAETANYSAISKTVTLFINKREVTVVVDNVYVEYGEQEKELTYEVNKNQLASTDDESELGITLTRYEGVTPNKYSITGSSSNINYNVTFVGNDNIVNSAYYEITKATPKITVITSSYVYDGKEHSVIATVNNTSQVVKFENNEPEVNVTEKDVTIFVEENDLYVAASTTAKLTITKKEYEYEFTTQYNTYDGRGHDPLFPVDFAENMNYEYEILFGNESVERATVAGEYTVNVTLIDNNHTGSYTFKYIMNKALPVIDVNRRDIVVNATSISADVEGYTYSIDNVNFVNELQFGALTPLTEYRVYVKCEESENYKSASKTIIVKTTRAASDITEKVALLGDELTSNNFAQLNEIAALLTEVSDADKLTIQSDIEFFERRVSEYNSKVSHLNTTAINAKNVSSKLIDFVITVSSSSLLMGAAALIVRKRFLGI